MLWISTGKNHVCKFNNFKYDYSVKKRKFLLFGVSQNGSSYELSSYSNENEVKFVVDYLNLKSHWNYEKVVLVPKEIIWS